MSKPKLYKHRERVVCIYQQVVSTVTRNFFFKYLLMTLKQTKKESSNSFWYSDNKNRNFCNIWRIQHYDVISKVHFFELVLRHCANFSTIIAFSLEDTKHYLNVDDFDQRPGIQWHKSPVLIRLNWENPINLQASTEIIETLHQIYIISHYARTLKSIFTRKNSAEAKYLLFPVRCR